MHVKAFAKPIKCTSYFVPNNTGALKIVIANLAQMPTNTVEDKNFHNIYV